MNQKSNREKYNLTVNRTNTNFKAFPKKNITTYIRVFTSFIDSYESETKSHLKAASPKR